MFAPQQSTLKRLFASPGEDYKFPPSGSEQMIGTFSKSALFMYCVIYFLGACCIAGSTMASGLMVPMLIVGAAYGRVFGLLLKDWAGFLLVDRNLNQAAYALIGTFGGVQMFPAFRAVLRLPYCVVRL